MANTRMASPSLGGLTPSGTTPSYGRVIIEWYATVTDTVTARTFVLHPLAASSSAATAMAEQNETSKFTALTILRRLLWRPIETFDPIHEVDSAFIAALGHRISLLSY